MQAIIREIIMYFLWLYMLMLVAYGNRDPHSYQMTANYKNMFVKGSYADNVKMETFNFKKVT